MSEEALTDPGAAAADTRVPSAKSPGIRERSQAAISRVSLADLAFAVMCLATVAVLLSLARDGIFYHDEWTFIDERSGWSVDALMRPHNEHWVLVPALVYNVLFSTVGLGSYLPYLVVLVVAHVATASALYALLRAQNGPLPGLGGGAIMLFLGTGYENLFWAFQIGFVAAAATGTWALVLTFVQPSGRHRAGAALLLVVAVATQGVGLFFAAAIAIALALDRERRRHLWVVAPAVLAYGLWYATFGIEGIDSHGDLFALSSVRQLADYVLTGAAHAIGQVTGAGQQVGLIVFVALLIGTAWHISGTEPLKWAAVAGLAGLLSQFVLIGLVRSQFGAGQATMSRYVYIAAIFVIIAASGWIGRRFAGHRLRSTSVLAVVVVAALAVNAVNLRDGQRLFRGFWEQTRAAMVAVEQYGGTPAVSEDEGLFPIPGQRRLAELSTTMNLSVPDAPLANAPTLEPLVVDEQIFRLVSDAFTVGTLPAMPEPTRRVEVESATDAAAAHSSRCIVMHATGGDPHVSMLVPGGMSVAVEPSGGGEAQVFLGLLAPYSESRSQHVAMQPGNVYAIAIPDIDEERRWSVRFDPPAGAETTRICVVAGSGT